jgi:hypothetical protein
MVVVPEPMPVTTPVVLPTVPLVTSLLDHVPPAVPSANVVVKPIQAEAVPVIADIGFTVTTAVVKHPVERVYVIVDVPDATPVTMPLADPIVAFDVVLLVHVPPASVLFSV